MRCTGGKTKISNKFYDEKENFRFSPSVFSTDATESYFPVVSITNFDSWCTRTFGDDRVHTVFLIYRIYRIFFNARTRYLISNFVIHSLTQILFIVAEIIHRYRYRCFWRNKNMMQFIDNNGGGGTIYIIFFSLRFRIYSRDTGIHRFLSIREKTRWWKSRSRSGFDDVICIGKTILLLSQLSIIDNVSSIQIGSKNDKFFLFLIVTDVTMRLFHKNKFRTLLSFPFLKKCTFRKILISFSSDFSRDKRNPTRRATRKFK